MHQLSVPLYVLIMTDLHYHKWLPRVPVSAVSPTSKLIIISLKDPQEFFFTYILLIFMKKLNHSEWSVSKPTIIKFCITMLHSKYEYRNKMCLEICYHKMYDLTKMCFKQKTFQNSNKHNFQNRTLYALVPIESESFIDEKYHYLNQ